MVESLGEDAAAGATLAEMQQKARLPCPRCRGRMMSAGAEGDLACFSCGHQIYRWAPESQDIPPRRRGASSGGNSLE